MPTPRNEILKDSAPEQKKGVLNHLNRHKGKYLLGLAALVAGGGTYALGKAGLGGHLATGANNMFMRNSPEWLTKTARQVSSVAGTRFVNLVDQGILRRPAPGGFPAEHVRKNIAEGRGPGED